MEKNSIPTSLICTDEFTSLGRAEAEALGMPGLPIVTVPHPLGGLKPDEVRQKAEMAIEEIVHVLTSPRDKLEKEYTGKYPEQKAAFKPQPKPMFA